MKLNPDESGIDINKKNKIFKKVADQFSASTSTSVSKYSRGNNKSTSLIYGEIQFDTFALVIEKIKLKYGGLQKPGGVFVDIGSGTGKPVLAAILMHEFDKVIGIEILSGLHYLSLELFRKWDKIKEMEDVSEMTKKTQVDLINGDILNVDWSNADIVYAHSTCFHKNLMNLIGKRANLMKQGSFFITTSQKLPSDEWEILDKETYNMSWGTAEMFIYQRI
jgi:hypothetical protein